MSSAAFVKRKDQNRMQMESLVPTLLLEQLKF